MRDALEPERVCSAALMDQSLRAPFQPAVQYRVALVALLALANASLAACRQGTRSANTANTSGSDSARSATGQTAMLQPFSLRFLRGQAPFVYDYTTWLTNVRRLDHAQFMVSIEDADVERYEVQGNPSGCARFVLTSAAAARLQAAGSEIREVPVVVMLGGELVYAAKEYLRYGAAAIRFPVVHRDQLGDRALEVCGGLGGVSEDQARVLDRAELREHFRRTNRLVAR
ncbi:MAG: hypothetical protein Q8Q09_10845 [Deltaproteobacteria bacterium]|nr:hypothetical protein [Deltaproteobacteria bacterium]